LLIPAPAPNGVAPTAGRVHAAVVTEQPEPTWSDIAGWYDALVSAGSGPHETAVECVRRLCPPLAGATVLDLACGSGLATRTLAAAGADRVVGVDSSEAMLAIAQRYETDGGGSGRSPTAGVTRSPDVRGEEGSAGRVAYLLDDAQGLPAVRDRSVDGVTCQLGLMDIPDLDAALAAVARVLRPGGWFVFVIGHPCFLAPDAALTVASDGRPAVQVTGYFHERFWRSSNPDGVRRAGNHHRRLSTYLTSLIDAGLVLEVVEEPEPAPQLAAQQPLYAEVPIFFAGRARTAGALRPAEAR
jgi:ubiquinone/menaquinone biosynthesis C-methylase UbiE